VTQEPDLPDADELVKVLRERLERRRRSGQYPEGLESSLDAHAHAIIGGSARRREDQRNRVRQALERLEVGSRTALDPVANSSRLPIGNQVHATFGRLQSRHLNPFVEHVNDLFDAAFAGLSALLDVLDDPDSHQHGDVLEQLDALFERLSALERSGRPGSNVEARLQRLEEAERQRSFEPFYSSTSFEDRFRGSQAELTRIYTSLADELAAQGPVLEIGCGQGSLLKLLAERQVPASGVELDPDSTDVHTAAARILLGMGEAADAEREAERAVELDDSSANAHFLVGQARLGAGKTPAEALPELHRAVQLNPYAPLYYDALARAYLAGGHRAEAVKTIAALRGLRNRIVTTRQAETTAARPVVLAVVGAALLGALAMAAFRRRMPPVPAALSAVPAEPGPFELRLVEALGAAGAFSLSVPYLSTAAGFSTGAPLGREIANHLLPGAILVAIAVVAVPRILKNEIPPGGLLAAVSLIAGLAGVVMTGSHLALIAQAARGQVQPEAALIHSLAGPGVIALAALLWRRSSPPGEVKA